MMKEHEILSVLRNPYGINPEQIRKARIEGADLIEKLKLENAALKEGRARYRHLKGGEYTVLCEHVHDEVIGPHALPDTVYVGKDGIKYRRPTRDFHGLKDGIKRFERI